MNNIFFHYADVVLKYNKKKDLKHLIHQLFTFEKKIITRIDYVFCSDEYLYKLNQTYLNHHTLTDIISFDLSEDCNTIIGEIYISTERVKYNAAIHKVSFINELHRVVFHGALHLCGYHDKTTQQKKQMRQLEDKYLNMFHVEH